MLLLSYWLIYIFDLLCSRWFDTAAQIHRVCCYCPIEAVSSDKYNDAFQVGEDESRDSCNATEDEVKQTGMWPFCICEHKMGLKPEFIGKY